MGHRQRHTVELKRMHVLQRNIDGAVVGHAAHMCEQALGLHFLGKVLQIAVKHRQGSDAIGIGLGGVMRIT